MWDNRKQDSALKFLLRIVAFLSVLAISLLMIWMSKHTQYCGDSEFCNDEPLNEFIDLMKW